MNNNLREAALQAAKEAAARYESAARAREEEDRRERVAALKEALKRRLGVDVDTTEPYIVIDGIEFGVVRHQDHWWRLVIYRPCDRCGHPIRSFPIEDLSDLGALLGDGGNWDFHECPEPENEAVTADTNDTLSQPGQGLLCPLLIGEESEDGYCKGARCAWWCAAEVQCSVLALAGRCQTWRR